MLVQANKAEKVGVVDNLEFIREKLRRELVEIIAELSKEDEIGDMRSSLLLISIVDGGAVEFVKAATMHYHPEAAIKVWEEKE